jgi:carbonic anhydrase/acetyltransferase-like protein (isoleucine patch superfamily)
MALILACQGKNPELGNPAFIAENATIIGDVTMGSECSVWFQAVIRGDVNRIILGDRVNVQDGAVIHCTYQKAATTIGSDVSIGHRAIVHGCTIENNVLIGMGSIVMDGAVIGSGSIVAAGAVVLEGTQVEPGSVYAGIPARKVKEVDAALAKDQIARIAGNYLKYSTWFE